MPRGPLTRDVQVSKKLSWLLRHHIESEKLTMNAGGYVNVQEVLNNRHIKSLKVTFDELRGLVASNDKQRFSIIPVFDQGLDVQSTRPQDYLIRANQGHSVTVDAESLLTPIDGSNMPTVCVHGTTRAAWTLIVSSGGLKRMTRQHIHFASGLPAGFKQTLPNDEPATSDTLSAPVISGMRNSSTVLIYLDLGRAMEAGLKFWLSENGVILTEGNTDGIVSLTYFKRVEDRKGDLGVLVQDGQIIKDAPAEWATKSSNQRGKGARE